MVEQFVHKAGALTAVGGGGGGDAAAAPMGQVTGVRVGGRGEGRRTGGCTTTASQAAARLAETGETRGAQVGGPLVGYETKATACAGPIQEGGRRGESLRKGGEGKRGVKYIVVVEAWRLEFTRRSP